MKFPTPRGPLSGALLELLRSPADGAAGTVAGWNREVAEAVDKAQDISTQEDLQLTLFCLYELHYSSLDGADEQWEWHPGLLAGRALIEAAFEQQLRAAVELPDLDAATSDDVAQTLFSMAAADSGPSMSRYVAKKASEEQLLEFLIHKSIYQLKEADPHTWAIPRLTGRAKAAMVEIQSDEYGGGRAARMHSALFARTMRLMELDDSYGSYLDAVPALTLANNNLMSMFGLNRRLRGAIVGHLAIYEMTSSQPNRLYGNGFRRHGRSPEVTEYFDEHVEADAVHEQIAGRDLAGGLFESEPKLLADIYFGAAAALLLDGRSTARTMSAWEAHGSSLLTALPQQAGLAS